MEQQNRVMLPLRRITTASAVLFVTSAAVLVLLRIVFLHIMLQWRPETADVVLPSILLPQLVSAFTAGGAATCGVRRAPRRWFAAAVLSVAVCCLLWLLLLAALLPQLNPAVIVPSCAAAAAIAAMPTAWLAAGWHPALAQWRREKAAAQAAEIALEPE